MLATFWAHVCAQSFTVGRKGCAGLSELREECRLSNAMQKGMQKARESINASVLHIRYLGAAAFLRILCILELFERLLVPSRR